MFLSRWKEGCARIPFREMYIWNSLSVTSTDHFWVKVVEQNDATIRTVYTGMKVSFSPALKLTISWFLPTVFPFYLSPCCQIIHKSESWAEDFFHNHQTCLQSQIKQMANASHKGHETKYVGHLHRRGQASSENQYRLFKCDQETRALIAPWQWTNWERSAWLLPLLESAWMRSLWILVCSW